MFRLIGNVSKKVYYESKNVSDLNKWRLKKFTKYYQKKGGGVTRYEAPEAMVVVKVKAKKSRKEYLNDLLFSENYEEYRKEVLGKSDRDIKVYGSGKDKPELINRRKQVEKLFRQGITTTAEIAKRVNVSANTLNNDFRELRKTYPELRQKRSKFNISK